MESRELCIAAGGETGAGIFTPVWLDSVLFKAFAMWHDSRIEMRY